MKRRFFICFVLLFPITVFCDIPSGWPVEGKITSGFGPRRHPITRRWSHHNGIDIRASTGTPVRTTANGKVTFAGWKSGGMGYAVVIDHGNGLTTAYGHLSRTRIKKGKRVKRGKIIAYSGNSGRSTGPHLYYKIQKDSKAVNPTRYLRGETQITPSQKMLVALEKGFETVVEIWGEKKVDWENTRTLLVIAERIEITKNPYQEGKFKVGIIRH